MQNKNEALPESAPLHIAMASPEIAPFAGTGGLADVMRSLPKALERLDTRVSLIMPAYHSVLQESFNLEDAGISFKVPISHRMEEGTVLKTGAGNAIQVYFIRSDKYFDRENLYGTPDGNYPDNAERFAFFSRAVLEILKQDPPDVLHSHEWQSALAIVFLKTQPESYPALNSTKTVFTIHNLGYQGIFPQTDWHLLDLDWKFFTHKFLEFYGKINFLKGGLVFADAITTVSPTYAEEIKSPEPGFGLDGVFRERASSLYGILNGVDYDLWNPEKDSFIAGRYNTADTSGKKLCKIDLQHCFGLPENPAVPLIGMVSRLVAQKGIDLLIDTMDNLLSGDIQFVLLGTGEEKYQDFFSRLPALYPGKAGVRIAFDEALAHKLLAGSDILLMPSLYEPGGLTQIYGLKYGTNPIVRTTGGLKDTIEEFDENSGEGNGFTFVPFKAESFLEAVNRALVLFSRKDKWRLLVRNAMTADYPWDRSAQAYLDLYRRIKKS